MLFYFSPMIEIKTIYDTIVDLYKGFESLSPLQKIEQEEKIKFYIDKTFHQTDNKAKLFKVPARISSIALNTIRAFAEYNDYSGYGDGYGTTHTMLRITYDIGYDNSLYELVRPMHNNIMVQLDGEVNTIKISRIMHGSEYNYWYSFAFSINLTLTSISAIKMKEIKSSLIGASAPKNSSCFIATAAFGHQDQVEVVSLRKFRDDVLLNSYFGRLFINIYETTSPPLAAYIRHKPFFRTVVRKIIRKLILLLPTAK